MVEAVMSLYQEAITKVQDGFGYFDQFFVQVGVHQKSELSPLLFATVINVVAEVRKDLFHEILYADELV